MAPYRTINIEIIENRVIVTHHIENIEPPNHIESKTVKFNIEPEPIHTEQRISRENSQD